MPYEFQEWEEELEPQSASSRSGGPPRKSTAAGVLDPPGPIMPAGPVAAPSASFLLRFLAWLLLLVLGFGTLFLLFHH
jgi:hypothetical protein